MCDLDRFSKSQSHIIAITANPRLNHSTYFTISLNELSIHPGYFEPIQGNFTVLFMHNIIYRSCDTHKLFWLLCLVLCDVLCLSNLQITLALYHSNIFVYYLLSVKWNFVCTLTNSGPAKTPDQPDHLLQPCTTKPKDFIAC